MWSLKLASCGCQPRAQRKWATAIAFVIFLISNWLPYAQTKHIHLTHTRTALDLELRQAFYMDYNFELSDRNVWPNYRWSPGSLAQGIILVLYYIERIIIGVWDILMSCQRLGSGTMLFNGLITAIIRFYIVLPILIGSLGDSCKFRVYCNKDSSALCP